MCIAIITTSHPTYPFILINNRDEYLSRPTAPASYWDSPYERILSGVDLEREAHGTWLGVTRDGRIACLTNFHEVDARVVRGALSRGLIINNWLKGEGGKKERPEEWAKRLVENGELEGVGGFTLTYGKLNELGIWGDDKKAATTDGAVKGHATKGLAILSNRTTVGSALPYVASELNQTIAVSNAPFGDRTWPKVTIGEDMLSAAVMQSVDANDSKDQLIDRLLDVLSVDNMPTWDGAEEWKAYTRNMQKTVFVRSFPLAGPGQPSKTTGVATPFRTDSPQRGSEKENVKLAEPSPKSELYGTQKQTVILVDREGAMTYFERTLFDQDVNAVPTGKGDRKFEFRIEEW